jgi:hypothetical protein
VSTEIVMHWTRTLTIKAPPVLLEAVLSRCSCAFCRCNSAQAASFAAHSCFNAASSVCRFCFRVSAATAARALQCEISLHQYVRRHSTAQLVLEGREFCTQDSYCVYQPRYLGIPVVRRSIAVHNGIRWRCCTVQE